jgi:hypothetical protein
MPAPGGELIDDAKFRVIGILNLSHAQGA